MVCSSRDPEPQGSVLFAGSPLRRRRGAGPSRSVEMVSLQVAEGAEVKCTATAGPTVPGGQ